jgi:hypothetical protein
MPPVSLIQACSRRKLRRYSSWSRKAWLRRESERGAKTPTLSAGSSAPPPKIPPPAGRPPGRDRASATLNKGYHSPANRRALAGLVPSRWRPRRASALRRRPCARLIPASSGCTRATARRNPRATPWRCMGRTLSGSQHHRLQALHGLAVVVRNVQRLGAILHAESQERERRRKASGLFSIKTLHGTP